MERGSPGLGGAARPRYWHGTHGSIAPPAARCAHHPPKPAERGMACSSRFGHSPGIVNATANSMNHTVLAAIDFSPVSRAVLATASDLACAIGGSIVVLYAVQPPMVISDLAPVVSDTLQFTADLERTARRQLERLAKRLS